ncbi:MAG TPA: hypothetical protein VGF45_09250 [Polyangia bacterium]
MKSNNEDNLEPLDADVAALFESASSVSPPRGAKDRVRNRVRMGIAAGGGLAVAAKSMSAAASPATTVLAGKSWMVASALSLGAVIGGLGVYHTMPSERAAWPAAVSPDLRQEVAPAAAPKNNTLPQEQALVLGARRALVAADVGKATALLSEHEARFPAGALVEERETLRILVAVKAGDLPTARARAAEFRRRFPASIQLTVIDHATLPASRR